MPAGQKLDIIQTLKKEDRTLTHSEHRKRSIGPSKADIISTHKEEKEVFF